MNPDCYRHLRERGWQLQRMGISWYLICSYSRSSSRTLLEESYLSCIVSLYNQAIAHNPYDYFHPQPLSPSQQDSFPVRHNKLPRLAERFPALTANRTIQYQSAPVLSCLFRTLPTFSPLGARTALTTQILSLARRNKRPYLPTVSLSPQQ